MCLTASFSKLTLRQCVSLLQPVTRHMCSNSHYSQTFIGLPLLKTCGRQSFNRSRSLTASSTRVLPPYPSEALHIPCLTPLQGACTSTSSLSHHPPLSVIPNRCFVKPAKEAPFEEQTNDINAGWTIRLANENGYLSWCRNTYLATVVGVGMWAEGPSSIAFHATEGALFLGGLNLVLGTISYLQTIFRTRRRIHMSLMGAGLHTLAALTHLGIWLTVVITYLGYVESEEEVRHPGNTTLEFLDPHTFSSKDEADSDEKSV